MTTSFIQDNTRLFDGLRAALKQDMANLSIQANGGRSILFVFPPEDEADYIEAAPKQLKAGYRIIDFRKSYEAFISEIGQSKFDELLNDLGTEVFYSQTMHPTLFDHIIEEIRQAYQANLIPVLIHTGMTVDYGFSNINIMEHEVVMTAKLPLVVFYPATFDQNGTLKFLGKFNASKYRCIVVK